MAIFISYSRQDESFVDALARNLIAAKHNVWIDRWELSLGDSLTQKIEGALTGADAILVILSRASVASDWCKRELSAGLVRELEEKKVIVMPCVIDDCQIPLFMRDKLYADFRSNPDKAFDLVDRSLARISNPLQGRFDEPKFHTDWALDWYEMKDKKMAMRWTFVDHGHEWPYVILSECTIVCDVKTTRAFIEAQNNGEHEVFMASALTSVVSTFKPNPLKERIKSNFPHFVSFDVKDGNYQYEVGIVYRRLGNDNGMDTVVHLDNNLNIALEHMNSVLAKSGRS